ncbi:MAG TPA: tetratricopeptide repeat protein [Pirellulaceae bacterium]|nr:tetratricopeptide repeat protein [Pirellulaceae bacterium]
MSNSAVDQALQFNLDGLEWARRRDFGQAWQCYSEAIRRAPHYGAFFHNRGLAAYEGGHHKHALADFDEALRLEPDNAETLCARAMAHAQLNCEALALADYERSLQLDPTAARTWDQRGNLYAKQGNWEAALADWRQAQTLQPREAWYWCQVGNALCELERHAEALPYLDRAIELGERGVRAFMWRGLCRRWAGDTHGAIADLNQALAIKPDHYLSLFYRGQIHHLTGSYFQAFEDYSRLIALGDDGARVRRERAELFLNAGKLKEAWSDLDASLKFEPQSLATYRLRARTLEAGGHQAEAERERARMDQIARQQCEQLRPQGQELTAALVQANGMLYEEDDSDLFCCVLFSFDPQWNSQPAKLQFLASLIFSLKGTQPADKNLRFVADMVTDEAAQLYRRVPLPMSLTEGAVVYFADLLIYRRFLPGRKVTSGQCLRVIAEPGAVGRVELLPP